jgi:glutamate--cysteine ligase
MSGTSKTIKITDKAQLVNWLKERETIVDDWRIGTEHEKFLFHKDDFRPVSYEGEEGIGALLTRLAEIHAMTPMSEHGHIIGLKDGQGGSITLEPGGQFELSGAPLKNLHQTCSETGRHLSYMREITAELNLYMLGVGFQPLWQRQDISWMPKGRYKIMQEYMPKRGNLGIDMMLRSCTVQVNLDYASETDMVRKFRASLALQPVATALFANSPFKNGQPSGVKSTRAQAWTDTDPDRCGIPSCVFEDDFGYGAWIEYILDVPMYFLHRGDDYIDVSGQSFRAFMDGKLPGFEGQLPRMDDFEDHITTAFPEVRLKGYLEMRGADSGSWGSICALPALWVGLLYDEESLSAAHSLISGISAQEVEAARLSALTYGLDGHFAGQPMLEVAKEMVMLSEAGLARRQITDSKGRDETQYLDPLRQVLTTGKTNADIMLDHFNSDWGQDVSHLFKLYRY